MVKVGALEALQPAPRIGRVSLPPGGETAIAAGPPQARSLRGPRTPDPPPIGGLLRRISQAPFCTCNYNDISVAWAKRGKPIAGRFVGLLSPLTYFRPDHIDTVQLYRVHC
jgi:hypothetical protein